MLIGIDMGGTNIDGVIIQNGQIIKTVKNQVQAGDIYNTVLQAILDLIDGINVEEIQRINLSTTVSTNAIVEGKTSKVDLIIEEGPGIVNDFSYLNGSTYKISGYIDHRGIVVKDLDFNELENIKNQVKANDVENLAIVSKFSTRNPNHENQIKEYFSKYYDHISCGHNMSGVLNFPRRVNTTFINESVYHIFKNFAGSIKSALGELGIKAPIYILKADGGTMTLDYGIKRPVETILSGPAASFMGISALADLKNDGVLLDIGGTTTDIFITIDDAPVFEPLGIEIKAIKTLVRSIYSKSIGLGGDSHIKIQGGNIVIGPERLDFPIVFGGHYPTLTDALAICGRIDISQEKIDMAKDSFLTMAKDLNLSVEDFANKVIDQATSTIKDEIDLIINKLNSKPVNTIREVLENKEIKVEELRLIGGPVKALQPYIESKMEVKTIVPASHEIANAIGACLARPTAQVNLIADTFRKTLSVPEVNIFEPVHPAYTMEEAVERVESILIQEGKKLGEENPEIEIIDANTFNMVDGYNFGRNIRIHGQIKPGLIEDLKGDFNEK